MYQTTVLGFVIKKKSSKVTCSCLHNNSKNVFEGAKNKLSSRECSNSKTTTLLLLPKLSGDEWNTCVVSLVIPSRNRRRRRSNGEEEEKEGIIYSCDIVLPCIGTVVRWPHLLIVCVCLISFGHNRKKGVPLQTDTHALLLSSHVV